MEISHKKFFVFSLMMKCPEGKAMIDCPLERYRNLSNTQKLNKIENFSDKKIDEIMIHHRKCSYRRIYKMVRGL